MRDARSTLLGLILSSGVGGGGAPTLSAVLYHQEQLHMAPTPRNHNTSRWTCPDVRCTRPWSGEHQR
eukprot:14616870-Alexandrium_andersonii.AAC.1